MNDPKRINLRIAHHDFNATHEDFNTFEKSMKSAGAIQDRGASTKKLNESALESSAIQDYTGEKKRQSTVLGDPIKLEETNVLKINADETTDDNRGQPGSENLEAGQEEISRSHFSKENQRAQLPSDYNGIQKPMSSHGSSKPSRHWAEYKRRSQEESIDSSQRRKLANADLSDYILGKKDAGHSDIEIKSSNINQEIIHHMDITNMDRSRDSIGHLQSERMKLKDETVTQERQHDNSEMDIGSGNFNLNITQPSGQEIKITEEPNFL